MNKNRSFLESLNNASHGIIFALRFERNLRIDFILGALVFIYSLFLSLTTAERAILLLSIFFVIFAEMMNTVIEHIIDFFFSKLNNPMIKIVKDISSGAVLLSALNSLWVGYFLIYKRSLKYVYNFIELIHNLRSDTVLLILIAVISLVVFLKVFTHTGTPFHGGFPSGHTAFSFSVATMVLYYVNNYFLIFLVFLMAFLVAKSRKDLGIHTWVQIFFGALIGVLVTLFLLTLIGG